MQYERVYRLYQQLKNIYHFFQAHFWRLVYGMPDKELSIFGITGTNGKTTTCYVLTGILAAAYGKEKVGMLTTVAFRVGGKEEINKTKLTTLPSRLVYRYLKRMRDAGVTHVVLEMTSHALDQHRLAGIRLDGAVILNIAREHLDYHRTMEEYAAAKMKIMNYLKKNAPLMIKGDDKTLIQTLPLSLRRRGGRGEVTEFTSAQAKRVATPLPGEVNKENVLAATLLAKAVGISKDAIARGVQSVNHVPGRMEWIDSGLGFKILIDYAVTPDALERLYKDIRSQTNGKIFAVLGAAGLRDRGKRPDMAHAVAKHADEIVITREDPWTEDEEQIFSDLESGLPSQTNWRRIVDRRQALQYLLQKAKPGDIVVVTGKGAERGMAIGKKIVPWNEKEAIQEILVNLSL